MQTLALVGPGRSLTDAAINPEKSGGAGQPQVRPDRHQFDDHLARRGNVGIGFAIPINMARRVMEQIVEKRRVSGLLHSPAPS